ncbi:MAG: VWA domain-containing protein [Alphaproteobacteria bacterium]|nr:VWA domain-containing protein [Alphaproteobacteria bacterium]
MTGFVFPIMFALLPLPLIVRAVLPPVNDENEDALKIPFFAEMESLSAGGRRTMLGGLRIRQILGALIWILLVTAAAGPQWMGAPAKIPSEGRNLMLVLDISGSMDEADFVIQNKAVRRWDAVQAVADAFIKKREGDRVGIVLFGERAYLYAPLTFDLKTVSDLLREADVGMAGPQTAIGDALGIALKTMIDVPAESKVVVLLSDGAANAGSMKPMEAADLAAKMGVKVYTIGAGSDTMQMGGIFGMMPFARGDEIDEKSLQEMAQKTGGRYFRAKNTQELLEIYKEIDALEPVKNDDVFVRPVKVLFYYPLAAAFGLSVLGALLMLAGRRGR